MNFGELVQVVAEKTGSEKKQTREILKAFLDEIVSQVEQGNVVRIRGFGSFRQKTIKGREVVTPKGVKSKFETYKTIKLKPSVRF